MSVNVNHVTKIRQNNNNKILTTKMILVHKMLFSQLLHMDALL
jgi:hypothetical protein